MNILMYHSVGEGSAPLSLSPTVFRHHMEALEDRGMRAISLRDYAENGGAGCVVLTFDDGYRDNLEIVLPELQGRGWSATVFLAVQGLEEGRLPEVLGERALLRWSEAEQLVEAGWEIGSHTLSHPDLTGLEPARLEDEIGQSRELLEQKLGVDVKSFAAPFGRTNPAVQRVIAKHYQIAVGTELGRVTPGSDPLNYPRIEMYYFSKPKRWESYLDGEAEFYLRCRQWLRQVKEKVS